MRTQDIHQPISIGYEKEIDEDDPLHLRLADFGRREGVTEDVDDDDGLSMVEILLDLVDKLLLFFENEWDEDDLNWLNRRGGLQQFLSDLVERNQLHIFDVHTLQFNHFPQQRSDSFHKLIQIYLFKVLFGEGLS
jgi:hypothetical protein